MKIIYYDCFAGISGDMNLGALVDLGVPEEYLLTELKKLNLDGYELRLTSLLKMGINGTRADVILSNKYNDTPHDHHEHVHDEKHKHKHSHENHEYRNLNDIRKIIEESSLNTFVKEKSLLIFHEIAAAEAKIHAKKIDEIHFHEVGAIDSIIDIVGAAVCIDYLKPDKILCSTIELGGGFIECAHGIFPVPAPATAEILKNIPIKKGTVDKETTTPTGAAILRVFTDEFVDQIDFIIHKIAYGIGHRDLKIPNVLRVYLGETKSDGLENANAVLIESNIDDMNPEYYEYIIDKLFDAGAQDVFLVPIIMKKSRPAVQIKVLCNPTDRHAMEQILLSETTSLGLRYMPVTKSMLERKARTIDTAFGPIRIKEAVYSNKTLKFKAEYDDCVKAAQKYKISLKEVYSEIDRTVEQMKNKA
jgi:uncharacterized protein (TIGR00299 family) protein